MSTGFIRLDRGFFDGEYWNQSRTFSQAEAWLDLIQKARFEVEPTIKILPSGRTITIERGEIHASLRYLSARWGWSKGKVERFLKNTDVGRRTDQGESILKLCNYDTYNPLSMQDGTPAGHRRDTGGTNNKKDKKDKKKPPIIPQGDVGGTNSRKLLFEEFRKAYPGSKRGLETEWENFKKKYPNYEQILPLLSTAVEFQRLWREKTTATGGFAPEWANLSTWINQRRWEQEFPEIKTTESNERVIHTD